MIADCLQLGPINIGIIMLWLLFLMFLSYITTITANFKQHKYHGAKIPYVFNFSLIIVEFKFIAFIYIKGS